MSKLVNIPSSDLIYPNPLWGNQAITIQEVLVDLMQPLKCEKKWVGDITADTLFLFRSWIASHYWKNYIDQSVSTVKLPRYFSAYFRAEVKLWNALLNMCEQMKNFGVISSAPSSFGSLIFERQLTLFQFKATHKSENLTGTKIRKSWQHENAQIRDYRNPFKDQASAPHSWSLLDEAIAIADRSDTFRHESYNPIYRARMSLVKCFTQKGLILEKNGRPENRGRSSKK